MPFIESHNLLASETTGVVLAGGASIRFGRSKALELVAGVPLVKRVIDRLAMVCNHNIVIASHATIATLPSLDTGVRVFEDIREGCGPLGGILTGLKAARSEWVLVVACDMPFLNFDLLRYILRNTDGADLVVPMISGYKEPIHAAYSQRCVPFIERQLDSGDLKIDRFYNNISVRYILQEEIDKFDPGHLSFFNINTNDDLERAERIAVQLK